MSKSIHGLAAILLMLPLSTEAGRKTSANYAVEADLVGFSGSISTVSSSGFQLMSTFGGYGSAIAPTSASGLQLQYGLWGGGNALRSAALAMVVAFGGAPHTATLTIPAGAFLKDYLITTSVGAPAEIQSLDTQVLDRANATLAKMGASTYSTPLGNRLWSIHAVDSDGTSLEQLQVPGTLTLPYDDADGDGIVDGTTPPLHAATLSLWWLDETNNLWVKIPNSTVDAAAKTVSAPIRHFSVYTLMGAPLLNVGEPYAFPVPFRPSGPNAGTLSGQTGSETTGITFTNVTEDTVIRVYSLSGALIRELRQSDFARPAEQKGWNVKSDSGEDLGTGTYIYVVEGQGVKKTGKLTVIR